MSILMDKIDSVGLSMGEIKEELKVIHAGNEETSKVQRSSSKILCFLVNDILDYAQLKQGKFRKDCT